MSDLIDRQAAIDAIDVLCQEHRYKIPGKRETYSQYNEAWQDALGRAESAIGNLPSAQPESCEYYALCRHGRDENKLRARLGSCEYCYEDADGFVTPLEKNGHAFVRFGMNGWELSLKANGWHGSAKIKYCPICGRRLTDG